MLCQCCIFPAPRVADGARALERPLQQFMQPVRQLCIVGRRIDRHADLAQEGRVINALMGLTIGRNKTGAVDGKHDVLLQQVHVVDDLVVRPLQEGGVDAHHRQHSLACKPGREGHRMLFRHADVKEPFRVAVGKELQAGTIFHGSRNGAQVPDLAAFLHKCLAKHCGEGLLGCNLGVRHPVRVKRRHAVVAARVDLGGLVAFALFGDDVQKMRARAAADGAERPLQFFLVMPVHRPDVLEPHVLKHGGVIHGTAYQRFGIGQCPFHGRAHHRHMVQETAHIIFCIIVGRRCAQVGQIPRQRAHIFGNGHLVVVQDHEQIVQIFNVVHAFVDHAAGERTVADDGRHKARLVPQLFGPGHADGKGKRRVPVPGNERVVNAFIRVRKAGNSVDLTKFIKLFFAAGEDLVRVALMPHIKDDGILRRFQHAVQRHGQFHRAKVRGQVAARF